MRINRDYLLDQAFIDRRDEDYQTGLENYLDAQADQYQATEAPAAAARKKEAEVLAGEQITNPVERLYGGSRGEFSKCMAAFMNSLDQMSDIIARTTGLEKGGIFRNVYNTYKKDAEYWDKRIQNRGLTEEILTGFLGGAIPGILQFALGPAYAGLKGFGEADAEGKDLASSVGEGLYSAAHRYLLGRVLEGINIVKGLVPKTAWMGSVGAADAYISSGGQASAREIAASAGTMGLFGVQAHVMEQAGKPKPLTEEQKKKIGSEVNQLEWSERFSEDPQKWAPQTKFDTADIILERQRRLEEAAENPTNRIDTPEREELRQQIADELYGSGASRKEGVAVIIMGPSASGKSSMMARPIAERIGGIIVDNDLAKERLPEYNGGKGAGVVHEESSDIVDQRVFLRALENGDNMVIPIVGKTLDKVRRLRDQLTLAGYDVHLTLVDLEPDIAAQRAVERYYSTGRFVDPAYILKEVGYKPRQNYETLIREGGLSSYEAYNADVPKGRPYEIIEEWSSLPGFLYKPGRVFNGQSPKNIGTAPGKGPEAGTEAPGRAEQAGTPGLKVSWGNPTNIIHSEGQDAARYAVVEAGDVVTSHNPLKRFSLNKNYPGNSVDETGRPRMLAQERAYHIDKDLQWKVDELARNIMPEMLISDNPDMVNGPTAVTPDLAVPGGNRRAMGINLAYEKYPESAKKYRAFLLENAEKFGLDPKTIEKMDRPMLVRVLMQSEPDVDLSQFARKVRLYNQSQTAALQADAEFVSRGRMISPETLSKLKVAMEGEDSLRSYLGKTASGELIKDLQADGVFSKNEIQKYFNQKTGLLTDQGKALVEGVIRGKVIDDYDLLSTAPLSALSKIDRSISSLAIIQGAAPKWDLSPMLKGVLEEYTRYRASEFRSIDEYLSQGEMFGTKAELRRNDRAIALLKAFDEMTPKQFAESMKTYASFAGLDSEFQNSFSFAKPPTPEEAFDRAFGLDGLPKAASPRQKIEILESWGDNIPEELKERYIQLDLFKDMPLLGSWTMDSASGKIPREEKPQYSVLAKAINSELVQKGWVNLRGKVAKTVKDLGVIAQMFRDPRYETYRIFYLKTNEDGTFTILGHEWWSQGIPGEVSYTKGYWKNRKTWLDKHEEIMINDFKEIKDRMTRMGADKFLSLHNHPTGRPQPSQNDLNGFANRSHYIKAAGMEDQAYLGEIIIDGKEMTYIYNNPESLNQYNFDIRTYKVPGTEKPGWSDPFLDRPEASIPELRDLLNNKMKISNYEELSRIAEIVRGAHNSPDYFPVVFRGVDGSLRGVIEVHRGMLKDLKQFSNFLRNKARDFGGDPCPVLPDAKTLSQPEIAQLLENRLCLDVIWKQGEAYKSGIREAGVETVSRSALGKSIFDYPPNYVREIRSELDSPILDEERVPLLDNDPRFDEFLKKPVSDMTMVPELEINWGRIDAEDELRAVIDKVSMVFPDTMLKAKGKQTHEETIKMAEELGIPVAKFIEMTGGSAFSAAEVTRMRWIHLSSGKKLMELAKSAMLSNDEGVLYQFRKQLAIHYAIQAQFFKFRAEAGRALSAWRIQAQSQEAMVKEISDLIASTGGVGTTREMARKISSLETPAQVATFARQSYQANGMDMLLEAWINGLLTSPVSHAVNMTSNSVAAIWQVPERYLAAKVSKVLDPQQQVYEREAVEMMYGLVEGFKDGFRLSVRAKDAVRKAALEAMTLDLTSAKDTLAKALAADKNDFGPAWKAILSGKASDQFEKIEAAKYRAITGANVKEVFPRMANAMESAGIDIGKAADLIGEFVRGPGRFLMAEDEIFKGIGYRMELRAEALRMATSEGLVGNALASRIQDILANPPDNLKATAVDYGRYLTFTQKLSGATAGLQMATLKNPALKFLVPFVRTPTNIFMFMAERSPLGLFFEGIRKDMMGTGPARDLAIARMTLGTIVMMMAYSYVQTGLMSGGGPYDKEVRASMRRTGWQPYSIKVGDTWIAYNRLEPFGSIIGLAADTAEIWNQIDHDGLEGRKLGAAILGAVAKNITSKTYLEGLSRFVDVLEDPERYGEKWVQQFIGSFVPAGAALAEKLIDPTIPEANTVLEAVRARIPGFSADVPAKRNLWGEPIQFEGALGPDVVSPFYQSRDKHSRADEVMVANRTSVSMPRPRTVFDGVELSSKQLSRYVEIMGKEIKGIDGKTLKEAIEDLVKDPTFQEQSDGPDGGKSFMIKRYVQTYRELAKRQLLSEDPEVLKAVVDAQKKKLTARMPEF